MENLEPFDLLLKKGDNTLWVFRHYGDPVYLRDLQRISMNINIVVVRPFGTYDDNEVETFPTSEFEKAPVETFQYGDVLTMIEDGSKWTFSRYVVEGITVSKQWADENDWKGSEGWKRDMYVTAIEPEHSEEQQLSARLFTKR